MPAWASDLAPIFLLLIAVAIVYKRLPKIDLGHDEAFLKRRVMNWLPLGMTYAFLYMGRYNLTAVKNAGIISGKQFGLIFGAGAAVYGLSFLLNGPLADRWGGRKTILIAAFGSAICNGLMGIGFIAGWTSGDNVVLVYSILYGANMYFQSFGAVSIVKVNSSWFHVNERGVFAGMFGILISLGIYFAFDWGHRIIANLSSAYYTATHSVSVLLGAGGDPSKVPDIPVVVTNGAQWVWFIPAILLAIFFTIDLFIVRDKPSDAGQKDFDLDDATSGDDSERLPALQVFKKMLTNPVILTIAFIEFCSGFLRNAIMHWYRDFAKGMSLKEQFVYENWGMLLCIAGIMGGVFAGVISDRVFNSRRGPVAAVLYGIMLVGAIVMIPLLSAGNAGLLAIGYCVVFMSMAIIGVHGMLSGTASQDFGGSKNAGIAVGLIYGFVYSGTLFQSVLLGYLLPKKGTPAASDIANWKIWPYLMIPVAAVGLVLAIKVWNAKPTPKKKA